MAKWRALFCLAACLYPSALAISTEQFDEELTIRPLPDGKVASTFRFTTLLQGATPRDPQSLGGDDVSQHYTVFPLALGQILREYAVTELHLSLNAGKWRYDRWGLPKELGVGTGAELWAWMGDTEVTSIDKRWKGLRNALAGLFCASLGSLDDLRTTSPVQTFQPEGDLPDWDSPHDVRHASLPSEHVCTENLTPFLKLLPCKSRSGIASLLNPHRLFDADWHGMGVHVLWREKEGVEVRLTFQSVSDPLRSGSRQKQDWSLHSLFGRSIERECPVAHSSRVLVALPQDQSYSITPEPPLVETEWAVFDTTKINMPLNTAMTWAQNFEFPTEFNGAPLTVKRTLRGTSQAYGQLSITVQNRLSSELPVLYLETMPWLVQFYLSTLKASIGGKPHALSNLTYIPAIPHSRPTTFQMLLTIPAKSDLEIVLDVNKAFLLYAEHPPDAQRGWDLPPAILTPLVPIANHSTGQLRIYTPTLLVDLATPDFSMPYNVIIFTCSLIAFLFGNVFNLLTRKFVIIRVGSDKTT
ncbi:Gpi16 subunit, GPI transamidase component [Pluteus cervinus]|uniref:Gpi16 subunit, GPI transamidase component n=1 Tax=Pluteus cervinus TaxID=181527 RepID=A0ACD3AS43_9AGAR|nr:Gpi16 subunit, GPI transamidase component [Pluteus cervinus]